MALVVMLPGPITIPVRMIPGPTFYSICKLFAQHFCNCLQFIAYPLQKVVLFVLCVAAIILFIVHIFVYLLCFDIFHHARLKQTFALNYWYRDKKGRFPDTSIRESVPSFLKAVIHFVMRRCFISHLKKISPVHIRILHFRICPSMIILQILSGFTISALYQVINA